MSPDIFGVWRHKLISTAAAAAAGVVFCFFVVIHRQLQNSNSETVVRCLQQRRGQPSEIMSPRGPVARCWCRVSRYAPGTRLLARLAAVWRRFFFFFFSWCKSSHIPPVLSSCHVHHVRSSSIITKKHCTLLKPGFSHWEDRNSSIIAVWLLQPTERVYG